MQARTFLFNIILQLNLMPLGPSKQGCSERGSLSLHVHWWLENYAIYHLVLFCACLSGTVRNSILQHQALEGKVQFQMLAVQLRKNKRKKEKGVRCTDLSYILVRRLQTAVDRQFRCIFSSNFVSFLVFREIAQFSLFLLFELRYLKLFLIKPYTWKYLKLCLRSKVFNYCPKKKNLS